jgi:hypothetical protein
MVRFADDEPGGSETDMLGKINLELQKSEMILPDLVDSERVKFMDRCVFESCTKYSIPSLMRSHPTNVG